MTDLLALACPEIQEGRGDRTRHMNMAADHDILDHRHAGEYVRALKRSRQPGARYYGHPDWKSARC
jgi:hypothetical protein